MKTLPVPAAKTIPAAIVTPYAREFAEWRIGGCPGYGFAEAFRLRAAKGANDAGVSYGAFFTEVSSLAAESIAAGRLIGLE